MVEREEGLMSRKTSKPMFRTQQEKKHGKL